MIGDGAEIHRSRIDHVAKEIENGSVHSAAAIGGKLRMPMKVAFEDATGLPGDGDGVLA